MRAKLDIYRTNKKGNISIDHLDVDLEEILEPLGREKVSRTVDYSPEDKVEVVITSIET